MLVHVLVELTANRLDVVVRNIREALAAVRSKCPHVVACRVVLGCWWFVHRTVAGGAANARSTGQWGGREGDVCARIGRSVFLVEEVAHSGRRRSQWEVAQIDLIVYGNGGCLGKHDLCSWLSPSTRRRRWRLYIDGDVLGVVHVLVKELLRVAAVAIHFQIEIVVPPAGPVQRLEIIPTRGQRDEILFRVVPAILLCKTTATTACLSATASTSRSAARSATSSAAPVSSIVYRLLSCFVSDGGRSCWLGAPGFAIRSRTRAPLLARARHCNGRV